MAPRQSGNTQPQVGFRHDERRIRQAQEIAKLRDERDLVGRGLSVVLRRALDSYVARNMRTYRDQLPAELQD